MTGLPHLDDTGAARMVDVGDKPRTDRSATARGRLRVSAAAIAAVRGQTVPKGDALAVARVSAILAAKRTSELLPLCHPVALSGIDIELSVHDDGIEIAVTCRCADRTGVEMEALTAVAVAGLTLHDMLKAIDAEAVLTDVRLVAKSGGRSGAWHRAEEGT